MPSYHRWGSHAQQSRLPLTPPEYQDTYMTPTSAMAEEGHSGYYPQGFARHGHAAREYADHYQSLSHYDTHQSSSHMKQMQESNSYYGIYPQSVPAQYQYAPTAPSMLAPIRVSEDGTRLAPAYSHAHPEPKPKEEKPTGGVAQHLDYEMDLMANFVAEMSQRIVSRGGSSPTPQFRKYVAQILSSTRLPSSTIMLGLFYLQERMKLETESNKEHNSSGTVYRMLTTCLLLGSKFLDDNTFQNRSWAEVSSIPVHELNSMELDWLKGFNWEIHGLMYDREEGFFMWIEHWRAYEEKARVAKAKDLSRLTPINTNLSRHLSMRQPLLSPEGPIPPQYQQGSQYDTRWVRPLISEYSPPSAPHSGPTTPDFYGSNWHYGQVPESYTRSSWHSNNASGFGSQRRLPGSYRGPYYGQGYSQANNWSGHVSNCGCSLCIKHPEYAFSNPGYGLQTVMG